MAETRQNLFDSKPKMNENVLVAGMGQGGDCKEGMERNALPLESQIYFIFLLNLP